MKDVKEMIKTIEELKFGKVVDQYTCEVQCRMAEFGKCKFFKRFLSIPVCTRRGGPRGGKCKRSKKKDRKNISDIVF